MATFPRDKMQFLLWAQAHAPIWAESAENIGLTAKQAADFSGLVSNLAARSTDQQVAKQAQKAATEAANDAFTETIREASDLVRAIRSFAVNSGDSTVYQTAQIPAPQPATPLPPPGQPNNFRFELVPGGALTLRWKAVHPQGSDNVVYFVRRKLATENAFTLIGASGEKSYTDSTIPYGTDGVSYIVTAQRGQTQGPASIEQTIAFGSVNGDGLTVTAAPKMKMAA
ncbi:MAG: fibronectin type III domain-containing protein [Phycisphaerales bacterium]|nr:fibronectin type III domain-containing protein [Phycisphaerales bacterium]